jgi:hypothetical protein
MAGMIPTHSIIKLALIAGVLCFALLGLLRITRELIRPAVISAQPEGEDEEL